MFKVRRFFGWPAIAGLTFFSFSSTWVNQFYAPSIPPPQRVPSKPLCRECLRIVEQAKPVSLDKIDASGGHKDHPHLGARDAVGNLGYVHNEIHLRLDPPSFNMSKDDLIEECNKRDADYRMLTEKVFVDLEADQKALGVNNRVKILCVVYTTEKNHENIPRIRETWGQKCDGFIVGSTKTDLSIDAVHIPHKGLDRYSNIWQKVRSVWSYVYDNYYDQYDWFHIGGDDMYLIVENLRQYLESEEIRTAGNGGTYLPNGTETSQTPLFLGCRMARAGNMNDTYNTGGPGYTLNKAALKTMVVDFTTFEPDRRTSEEDVMVSRLLKRHGIEPYHTTDEKGGERYMHFMPGRHYVNQMPRWYSRNSINNATGVNHCAAKSIAFHYVKGTAMYRLHAILYNLCATPGTQHEIYNKTLVPKV